MKRKSFTRASLIAVAGACAGIAAQHGTAGETGTYPTRPIRIIVPQAPGGSNDIMARYFGQQVGERVGRQFVVDNRPGAEGKLGTELVAKSSPDGYTLLMTSTAFTMNPAVMKMPYDPIKDFDWVGMLGSAPVVICVSSAMPVKTLKELVALGKSKPNYLTIASAGGFMHFVSAMFRSRAGIDGEIVLYKGGAPAIIDVISGQAHLAVGTIVTVGPHLRSGKLRPLATGATKRAAALPDVPTASEAGVPGYEASIWWAWSLRSGTPTAILNRLSNEVIAVQKLPETAKRFATEGAEIVIKTPAEMKAMIAPDIERWEKVARDAGMPKQ